MALARVLLADDYPAMVNKVTQLLGGEFDIVGSAHDGGQALEAAARLNPDLLILDISMPILSGIQVAAHLRDSGCKAKLIFLTIHEDQEYIDAAFAVGALGYVLKSRVATDLLPATYAVLQGHRFYLPARDLCTTLITRLPDMHISTCLDLRSRAPARANPASQTQGCNFGGLYLLSPHGIDPQFRCP